MKIYEFCFVLDSLYRNVFIILTLVCCMYKIFEVAFCVESLKWMVCENIGCSLNRNDILTLNDTLSLSSTAAYLCLVEFMVCCSNKSIQSLEFVISFS